MNVLQNLGARERLFVIGGVAALLLIILYAMVIDPLMKQSVQLDRQIVKAQHDVQELYTLQRQYQAYQQVLDDINAKLRRQKHFAIFSHLEKLAGDTGIRSKILYMKPTVSTPSDAYEEESVEIKMEGVTLEQLIRYLYQVENSPQFLKIKRLYIKPRFDNRQLLTATFRVSTFTPKKGAA
jgi:general secretion pathway protein M